MSSNCHLRCTSVIQHAQTLSLKHLITIRDVIVSMLSTIPERYSTRQIFIWNCQCSLINWSQVTSPDLLSNDWSACRQIERLATSATLKTVTLSVKKEHFNQPIVSANHPLNRRKAAQSALKDIFSSTSITSQLNGNTMLSLWHSRWWIKQLLPVICGVSPQAILHAEEEGSGDVGDCQSLWPPHRMEPFSTDPEGQTPQEPGVWVSLKSPACTFRHVTLHPA